MTPRWLGCDATLVLLVAVAGCGPIDVTECDEISKRDECESADVDFGECLWVDVYTPTFDLSGCHPGQPHGMCMGFSGTQAGCGAFACAEPMSGAIVAFEQVRGENVTEVFPSPVCGPRPADDWTACDPGQPSTACQCLCEVSGLGD